MALADTFEGGFQQGQYLAVDRGHGSSAPLKLAEILEPRFPERAIGLRAVGEYHAYLEEDFVSDDALLPPAPTPGATSILDKVFPE